MTRAIVRILLLAVFLSGCRGNRAAESSLPVAKKSQEPWISEDKLKSFGGFVYNAELQLSLGQAEKVKSSQETVQIEGNGGRFWLKKSLDSVHFMELFKEGDSILVKSQNGPWQQIEKQPKIFEDSLNLAQWLAELALVDELKKKEFGAVSKFSLRNAPLSPKAPLLKRLAKLQGLFSAIKSSNITLDIEFDQGARMPVSSSFLIEILGEKNSFLKIKASMVIAKKALWERERPMLGAQALMAPVNLTSRFDELMKQSLTK